MKLFLYSSLLCLALMTVMDLIWFSITIEKFYKPYIGHIISGNFNYFVAAIFYTMYSLGISYLIILPSLEHGYPLAKVFCNALVLGILAYGAYDLTNQATISSWPTIVSIVDILWGGFITSSVSTITFKILS